MLFLFIFALVIINTVFWSCIVFVFTGIKLVLPGGSARQFCSKMILYFSSQWIACNNFFIEHIARVPIEVRWEGNPNQESQYLVIANHQSWVDILVLQKVFLHKAPFLRFFLKKELFWLPFLGLAFWALDFPFMNRFSKEYLEKYPDKKGKDLEATIRSCRKFSKIPFSLINFPEGTRFTDEKHEKQNPQFKYLLNPKAGGTAFALESFEGNIKSLIDVTIFYPRGGASMKTLMNGSLEKIEIELKERKIPEDFGKKSYLNDSEYRKEFQSWLNELWKEKDEKLRKWDESQDKA